MNKLAVVSISLIVLVLVLSFIGCGKQLSPTADEHYREQEAIQAVHSYLYSLAKGPAANNYVLALIWGNYNDYNDLRWRAYYNSASKEWTVETYRVEPSGLEVTSARWRVYPEDMSKIDSREWDATQIKGIIEELSKGY